MTSQVGISIGALAQRTGLAVSAVRYYEGQGLIAAWRNAGGHRRFSRADIRRVSFIRIAQQMGVSLSEIRSLLDALPDQRTPTRDDWRRLSERFRGHLDAQIAQLERTRDKLDDCIGCGCLSLAKCHLYNPDDQAARHGAGPRYLLGDTPDSPSETG